MAGILEERLPKSRRNQKKEIPDPEPDEKTTDSQDENGYETPHRLTEEDIEQMDELDRMMSEENFTAETRQRKMVKRVSTILMTMACCYLVFLIYGSIITEFEYNDKGEVAPVVLSVSDISDRNEYNSIVGMYLQARSLYETLLTLDYRMAAGTEDTMSIAPDYEKALDTVSSLTTQIDAAVIDSKYTQVKNMLLTWVKTHAAAYCQYMSTAITQNDSDAASEAIAARQVLSDNFSLITQNIVTLGGEIKGYDLSDIKDWSPDGFVQETIEGISSDATETAAETQSETETTEKSENAAGSESTEDTDATGATQETQAQETTEASDNSLADAQAQIIQQK